MAEMKVTNAQILTALGTKDAPGGLMALSAREIRNIKASYAITRSLQACEKPAEAIEKERVKLVERFSEKDADGKPVMLDETHIKISDPEAFNAAFQELLAEEVTLPGARPVTVDQLEGSNATPRELLTAGPFVVES